MIDDLVKACLLRKIIVVFSENPDLVSNIYRIYNCFVLNWVQFSIITENIFLVRQAFSSVQHGFFRSIENADLHNIIDVVGESIGLL